MIRVSKRLPCPICQKPDWCLVAEGGAAAICKRVKSDHLVGTKDAGWLHKLRDDRDSYYQSVSHPKTVRPEQPQRDWPPLAERYQRAMTDPGYRHLASELELSVDSLRRLQVGWDGSKSASTWPMRNADGVVVGIRTRTGNGKRAIGGTDGNGLIFDPAGLTPDYLLICEGPTDTAALLDSGFDSVVGRPSCRGGTVYIISIIERLRPAAVLLIPDRDEAGLSGFGELAAAIASSGCIELHRIDAITPPEGINDTRQWAQKNRDHLSGRIAASLENINQRTETSND
ncbi:hypothetical protein OAU26_08175 [Mariniblastus sp.]|nr:hypothetical protein [Mariniblastus sp.]